MTATYALVNASGQVTNLLVIPDITKYPIPTGCSFQAIGSSGAGIGWAYANGTFTAPPPPTLTPQQQAAVALAGGIHLTSAGTPTLNGTYSTTAASVANVNAVTTYTLINGNFPGAQATMPWYDTSGTAHVFSSVAEFKTFATAFANYVAAVQLFADSNGTVGTLPSNQLTVA